MKRAFSAYGVPHLTYKVAHARFSRLLCVLWCMALGSMAVSCGSPPSSVETAREVAQAPLPEYKVVFFIHGDGGYLFHDGEGEKYRADEEALAGARRVAQRNTKAEVSSFTRNAGGMSCSFSLDTMANSITIVTDNFSLKNRTGAIKDNYASTLKLRSTIDFVGRSEIKRRDYSCISAMKSRNLTARVMMPRTETGHLLFAISAKV